MKSRSKSSNKAEKQMFEAETVTEIINSSLETGHVLCLQTVSYKPTQKLFKRMTKLKNQIMLLKANIFKSDNRLKISTTSDKLRCDKLGSQFGLLIMRPQNKVRSQKLNSIEVSCRN